MFEIPFDYLMFANIILILLFLLTVYRGYKNGMLLQFVGLINTFVASVIAWLFSDVFVFVFKFVKYSKTGIEKFDSFVSDYANRLIWFVVLFVAIRVLLIVLKPIASMISKMPLIKQVNSAFGAAFSVVTYFIYMMILIFILTLPLVKNGTDVIDNSFLKYIDKYSEPIFERFDNTILENKTIQYLVSERELTVSQKQSLVDLLSENGFTDNEIREFLVKYHD
ncbi:MAG TPA: CvpA family protein [Erysipelothrix sp.]|nr:CvpA family protein [Erysipelothrix sp.]